MLTIIASAAIGDAPQKGADSTSSASLPRYSKLSDLVRQSLRREAAAKSESERIGCLIGIADLADQLRHDPRYSDSPTLKRFRGWLLSRLRSVRKEMLASEWGRRQRPAEIRIEDNVLAQLNAAVNNRPPPRVAANRPRQIGAGRRAPLDYGPLLVEVIQRTISPGSWDVNGGNSTIVYYRPAMALVVRAPEGTHGQLDPVLGQLRRAN